MQPAILKIIITIFMVASLSGCGTKQEIADSRLEGTWISDKQKTLEALDKMDQVPREVKRFLEVHLGELGFVFKGQETAVMHVEDHLAALEFEKFIITNTDQNSISIQTSRGAKATYYFEGNCFYLKNRYSKYIEYFCK